MASLLESEEKFQRRGKHHFQHHVLNNKLSQKAVLKLFGVATVAEALEKLQITPPAELRELFSKVYNATTTSQNKKWLQRRLAEALRLKPSDYFPLSTKSPRKRQSPPPAAEDDDGHAPASRRSKSRRAPAKTTASGRKVKARQWYSDDEEEDDSDSSSEREEETAAAAQIERLNSLTLPPAPPLPLFQTTSFFPKNVQGGEQLTSNIMGSYLPALDPLGDSNNAEDSFEFAALLDEALIDSSVCSEYSVGTAGEDDDDEPFLQLNPLLVEMDLEFLPPCTNNTFLSAI